MRCRQTRGQGARCHGALPAVPTGCRGRAPPSATSGSARASRRRVEKAGDSERERESRPTERAESTSARKRTPRVSRSTRRIMADARRGAPGRLRAHAWPRYRQAGPQTTRQRLRDQHQRRREHVRRFQPARRANCARSECSHALCAFASSRACSDSGA